jgi:hypothetical protein
MKVIRRLITEGVITEQELQNAPIVITEDAELLKSATESLEQGWHEAITGQTIPLSELWDEPIVDACSRCAGCGQIASDKEGTPWCHYTELPVLPTPVFIVIRLTVLMRIVKPLPCPDCSQNQNG